MDITVLLYILLTFSSHFLFFHVSQRHRFICIHKPLQYRYRYLAHELGDPQPHVLTAYGDLGLGAGEDDIVAVDQVHLHTRHDEIIC